MVDKQILVYALLMAKSVQQLAKMSVKEVEDEIIQSSGKYKGLVPYIKHAFIHLRVKDEVVPLPKVVQDKQEEEEEVQLEAIGGEEY